MTKLVNVEVFAKVMTAAEESELAREIEQYGALVRVGGVECNLPSCHRCTARKYWRNGVREREFLVIVENFIRTVLSCLSLWKCAVCGKSYTLYPEFALPYKRFPRPNILDLCERLADGERLNYQTGVKRDKLEIGYEQDDARLLGPSTLHRWVAAVGGMSETIRQAVDLILQKNPSSSIIRELAGLKVDPRKWRKPGRALALMCCRQIVRVQAEFKAAFHVSSLPDLGIGTFRP